MGVIQLLDEAQRLLPATGLQLTPTAEATRIRALARGSCWADALFRLRAACIGELSLETFNSVLSACRLQAEQWRSLVDVLEEMWRNDLNPNADSYEAASCCEAAC